MNIIFYTITVIAISVALSTIINILIMRKVSEMAVFELKKMHKGLLNLIEKLVGNDYMSK